MYSKKCNSDIRRKARESGVYLWEVAHQLGITDFTLSRHLRYELPPEQKLEVYKAIDAVAAEKDLTHA